MNAWWKRDTETEKMRRLDMAMGYVRADCIDLSEEEFVSEEEVDELVVSAREPFVCS